METELAPLPDNPDILRRLATTQVAVEATSYEEIRLWEFWNKRLTWKQRTHRDYGGYIIPIQGELVGGDVRPICISLQWNYLGDDTVPVLFWHPTSMLVDYELIEKWFKKYLPNVKSTSCNNLHNALHEVGVTWKTDKEL